MKCMIFAAGRGTRLRPLTDHMPKALVSVGTQTLLEHTLRKLIDAGATEVVVNVHHFREQIIRFLTTKDWGIPIQVSDELDELLDTGGGLRHAAQLFTQDSRPVLIHNVDILSNANLQALYADSLNHDATLLVSSRPTQRYLLFDDNLHLKGRLNTTTGEVHSPEPNLQVDKYHKLAFAGIHCFAPRLFSLMKDFPQKFSIIDFYLSICNQVDIQGCLQPSLQILDVGKPDTLRTATAFLRKV